MSNNAIWIKAHGGYGRPAKSLHNEQCRMLAIMVTLPKLYAENHDGIRYLVTDRRQLPLSEHLPTQYFVKRADAIVYAEKTFL